jgi:hypothetical protein
MLEKIDTPVEIREMSKKGNASDTTDIGTDTTDIGSGTASTPPASSSSDLAAGAAAITHSDGELQEVLNELEEKK